MRSLLTETTKRLYLVRLMCITMVISVPSIKSLQAQEEPKKCDIRLNALVSSSGHLTNDGKGRYVTGQDWTGIWLNPSRWPNQSFHICMNWPFGAFYECDSSSKPAPTGTKDSRTLLHHVIDPVFRDSSITPRVFTGPGGGNDIALSRPLTASVNSFMDMPVGMSLSPLSAEVRFCNADCSEYYSILFGNKSLFGSPNIHGAGTTLPLVTRTSKTTWRISFPSGTIGRLWNRTPEVPTSALYRYEGMIEIELQ